MHINGVHSYASLFQTDGVSTRQSRVTDSTDMEKSGKTAIRDTVSFSSEALEKYLAAKNGSDGAEEKKETEQELAKNSFFQQSHDDGKKIKRMNSAELIAFLKSDTFAEEAMGYARAVATEAATSEGGEDAASDQIIKDMDAKKHADSASTGDDEAASQEGRIEDQAKNNSGSPVVNGKRADAKELAAEIHKLEEEVKELTATYELIMGGEGELEEKLRLGKPVQKRLDERLHDLQAMKAQMQMMQEEKTAKSA